jgi:hypothetical protein
VVAVVLKTVAVHLVGQVVAAMVRQQAVLVRSIKVLAAAVAIHRAMVDQGAVV